VKIAKMLEGEKTKNEKETQRTHYGGQSKPADIRFDNYHFQRCNQLLLSIRKGGGENVRMLRGRKYEIVYELKAVN